MKRALVMMGLCSFVFAACDKPAEEKNTTTTTNANATATAIAPTPAPTAAPVPVTIADSDLSTPADFEETVEKSINAKNYKQELAAIDSDLSKE